MVFKLIVRNVEMLYINASMYCGKDDEGGIVATSSPLALKMRAKIATTSTPHAITCDGNSPNPLTPSAIQDASQRNVYLGKNQNGLTLWCHHHWTQGISVLGVSSSA